ncbi:Mpv17-like protein [Pseudolycoriella hygida]|uniref:Mpv17-like protein n=1 Tax=Pseudolycoriella hygida TaxID=35572 RepID=A0A9Q0ND09_9DIPT|nr:Mpv17-like protein [Pseudolycoriella hygida]
MASNFIRSFFAKHPLISNSLIYGSLYVGAEFSQQFITRRLLTEEKSDIDKPTLVRYAVMGTFAYSPILYNWYKWLDRTLPGTSKVIIVKKLVLDQFGLTPVLLVIFFTGMSIMERKTDVLEECREKFLPTFARSCLFWLPAQSMNFLFIPPRFRVIYVGTCSFIWVNILCWVKRQSYVSNETFKVDNNSKKV